jgi:predicted nicotinamide N-methyase
VGQVVLTDYVEGLLLNTQKNVDANGCAGTAVVASLDWTNIDTPVGAAAGSSTDGGSGGGAADDADDAGTRDAGACADHDAAGRYIGSTCSSSGTCDSSSGNEHTSTCTSSVGACSSRSLLPAGRFDVIIAADVIYDEWHADAVVQMCCKYLKRRHAQAAPTQQQPGAAEDALENVEGGDAAGSATRRAADVQCIVVLGDRAVRRGIPSFEDRMLAAGFTLVHSDCQPLMSEYMYSWQPPPQ